MRLSAATAPTLASPPRPTEPYSSKRTVATTRRKAPRDATTRTEFSANRSRSEKGAAGGAGGAGGSPPASATPGRAAASAGAVAAGCVVAGRRQSGDSAAAASATQAAYLEE